MVLETHGNPSCLADNEVKVWLSMSTMSHTMSNTHAHRNGPGKFLFPISSCSEVFIYLFASLSTFCVNPLTHWLSDTPFDDKHIPWDHVFTALVMIGEVEEALSGAGSSRLAKEYLPVIGWEAFQEQSKGCPLVLVSGFIHDVSALTC